MKRIIKNAVLQIGWKLNALRLSAKGCQLEKGVRINGFPYVRRHANGEIVLGHGVMINASLWANPLNSGPTALWAGPGASIILRKSSGISATRLVAMKSIEIGEESLIGAGSLICDSDMHEVPLGCGDLVGTSPIKIGKKVFVGAQSIILKGVTIGDGAVIGAGSVVCRNVPAGVIAAGNPAKILREI